MLKKYVGGLTLLVFTFTFVVPLLIGVNTADASPTEVITLTWRTNFYCPDGSYSTYSSGVDVTESYDDHPDDKCKWVKTGEKELICGGGNCWEFDKVEWQCEHVDHGTTYTYEEDFSSVTLWNNRVKCPDDDEDEETTN